MFFFISRNTVVLSSSFKKNLPSFFLLFNLLLRNPPCIVCLAVLIVAMCVAFFIFIREKLLVKKERRSVLDKLAAVKVRYSYSCFWTVQQRSIYICLKTTFPLFSSDQDGLSSPMIGQNLLLIFCLDFLYIPFVYLPSVFLRFSSIFPTFFFFLVPPPFPCSAVKSPSPWRWLIYPTPGVGGEDNCNK